MSDQEEYHLVHMDNNMIEVLYQLKDAGFESYIKYQAGKISQKKTGFTYKNMKKKVTFTQHLIAGLIKYIYIYIQRDVDTEDVLSTAD